MSTRRLQLQLAFLPWLTFSLITCLFAFTDGEQQAIVWLVSLACLLMSIVFLAASREGKPGRFTIGVLCMAALFAGMPVGLLIWDGFMKEYTRLDGGATYRNLSPVDPVSAHSDATMVEFANGSFVDRDNAIGYMKANTVYCAAPIYASGRTSTPAENWAVGVDCCDQQGGFNCGSVDNSDARSGIVAANHLSYYTNAARMAVSIFGLAEGSGDFAFVKWVKDIDSYKDDLLVSGVSLVVAASIIHLVASVSASFILVKAIAKQRAAKR